MPAKQEHADDFAHVKRQDIVESEPDHHEREHVAGSPEVADRFQQQPPSQSLQPVKDHRGQHDWHDSPVVGVSKCKSRLGKSFGIFQDAASCHPQTNGRHHESECKMDPPVPVQWSRCRARKHGARNLAYRVGVRDCAEWYRSITVGLLSYSPTETKTSGKRITPHSRPFRPAIRSGAIAGRVQRTNRLCQLCKGQQPPTTALPPCSRHCCDRRDRAGT